MTKMFVEQPLASPGSAKYQHPFLRKGYLNLNRTMVLFDPIGSQYIRAISITMFVYTTE